MERYVSRRQFFFFGAAAGITLATAGPVELFQPRMTRIHVPVKDLYARIVIPRAEILQSAYLGGGAFVRAITEELAQIARGVERENLLRLMEGGRPALTQIGPGWLGNRGSSA